MVTNVITTNTASPVSRETFLFFYHGSLSDPLRLELSSAVLLKAFSVWAMWGHHAVEAGPSWLEALLFGLIVTFDQTHEFAHAIT